MLMFEDLVRFVSRKSNISMAHPILLLLLLMPLAGCTGEGAGGPAVSSLSTPTDATEGLDSDQASNSDVADSDGEEDPIITMTPTPTGAIAHVTWDPPRDTNVAGYKIYYRKLPSEEQRSEESSSEESSSEESSSEESSSEEPSACSYEERQTVEAPPATITGLEPNTQYLFAISAFNGSESLCSNEIMAVTPSAQS